MKPLSLFLFLSLLINCNVVEGQDMLQFHAGSFHNSDRFTLQNDTTFYLYTDSVAERYSRKFGKGVLVATAFEPNQELVDMRVISVDGLFYGGSSSGSGGLFEATVEAMVWINRPLNEINSLNYNRKSSAEQIRLEINQAREYSLAITDTSAIGDAHSFIIGFYYKSGVDSLNSVSPIFNEGPAQYDIIYLSEIVSSSGSIDTIRTEHDEFWSDGNAVGNMISKVKVRFDSLGQATKIEYLPEIPEINITNYPNPFNPVTTIKIRSQEKLHQGELFSVLGRKVAELDFQNVGIDQYRSTWNAENSATGIYFLKVQLSNRVYLHKMLYIK